MAAARANELALSRGSSARLQGKAYKGHLSGVVRFSLSRLKHLTSTAEATGKLISALLSRPAIAALLAIEASHQLRLVK